MEKALISVIIPVYNLEKYISKCIDSVLKQSYSDFEIIAVDDGSTDDSAEILREYAKKDSRVKPVFKENGGVSSARNMGIYKSTGKYIYFLDGDDWIGYDTFEKMLAAEGDFDIVQGAHVNSYVDGTEEFPIEFESKTINTVEKILGSYFINEIQESCCNKLFKKIAIANIRFDEKMAVAEDSKFVYEVLKNTTSVKLLSELTYHYFCRENSCTHEILQEKHFDPLKLRDSQFEEIGNNKQLREKFMYPYSKLIFYLIREILLDKSGNFNDKIPMLRQRVLSNNKNILFSRYIGLRFKIGVLILWIYPKLFYKLYSN